MKALLICGVVALSVLGDSDAVIPNPLGNTVGNPLVNGNSLLRNGLGGGLDSLPSGLSSGAVLDTLVNAFVTDGYLNPAGQTAVRMSGLATEAYRDPELNDVLTGRTPALDSAGNLSTNVRQALHNRGIEATRPEDLMPYALNRAFSTTGLQPRRGFAGMSSEDVSRMRSREDLGGRMMDSRGMGPRSMDRAGMRPNSEYERMMMTMRPPPSMDYNRMRSGGRPPMPGAAPYRFQEASQTPSYPSAGMYGPYGPAYQYAPYQPPPPMNYFPSPYLAMNPMYGLRMDMDPFRSMYVAPPADRPFVGGGGQGDRPFADSSAAAAAMAAARERASKAVEQQSESADAPTVSLLNAMPPRPFGETDPRMVMGGDPRMDTRLAPEYGHHSFAGAGSPTVVSSLPVVDANAIALALGQSDIDIAKLLQSLRKTGIDINAIHQSLYSRHIDWNAVVDGLAASNIDINGSIDKLQDVNINNVLTALGSSNLNLSHLLLSMLQGTKPQDLDTSSVLSTGNDFSTIFSDPDVGKILDIVTALPTLPPTPL